MPKIDVTVTEASLNEECERIAKDIFEEVFKGRDFPEDRDDDPEDWRDDMYERAQEDVDGHQWIIYSRYPLEMLLTCNTDNGEETYEQMGYSADDDATLNTTATRIAFWEMLSRVEQEIENLIRDYEPPEVTEEEDEEEDA
jgi:hypothetical protein